MAWLHVATHSSQMNAPCPAINLLTWYWDRPQKEQRSSLPRLSMPELYTPL
jgi:hypothetical protein